MTSDEERFQLMFRMLDDANLDERWHQEIYDLVLAHRTAWLAANVPYMGKGQGGLFEGVQARLVDSRFPRSKDWVYLMFLTEVPDRRAAIALIERHAVAGTAFVQKVAAALRDELTTG